MRSFDELRRRARKWERQLNATASGGEVFVMAPEYEVVHLMAVTVRELHLNLVAALVPVFVIFFLLNGDVVSPPRVDRCLEDPVL